MSHVRLQSDRSCISSPTMETLEITALRALTEAFDELSCVLIAGMF
jgi:hypothetical protein